MNSYLVTGRADVLFEMTVEAQSPEEAYEKVRQMHSAQVADAVVEVVEVDIYGAEEE